MTRRSPRISLVVAIIVATSLSVSNTAAGKTLVLYSASTGALPPPPWVFISDGPIAERSQHTVFVQSDVLHLIDTAFFLGNSLGFAQNIPVDPNQVIDVEFRCRVISGQSTLFDGELAPFEVFLSNGSYRADISIGPGSLTALGRRPPSLLAPTIILDVPFDGTEWHTYRFKLTPAELRWFADDIFLARVGVDRLLVQPPDDRRINMAIGSAIANVELAYIKVDAATNISIDIKPGSSPASINPKSNGVTPVAILATDAFNVAMVDPKTISFGANGTEAVALRSALEDVNHDGYNDLIIHFQTSQTGIRCGDVNAVLKAKTFAGEDLEGNDAIRTVPCK